MNESDKAALHEGMNEQAERHVRAMQVPFIYWHGRNINGDDGQFADRDLKLAQAERLEQKGKD